VGPLPFRVVSLIGPGIGSFAEPYPHPRLQPPHPTPPSPAAASLPRPPPPSFYQLSPPLRRQRSGSGYHVRGVGQPRAHRREEQGNRWWRRGGGGVGHSPRRCRGRGCRDAGITDLPREGTRPVPVAASPGIYTRPWTPPSHSISRSRRELVHHPSSKMPATPRCPCTRHGLRCSLLRSCAAPSSLLQIGAGVWEQRLFWLLYLPEAATTW
jgi:hypothetical protein